MNGIRLTLSGSTFDHSPCRLFNRNTTLADIVTVCSVLEFHIKGPKVNLPADSACFSLNVQAGIGKQQWAGYYDGHGDYVVRYAPKQAETISYTITSAIPGFSEQAGQFVVNNVWPGKVLKTDYKLGPNWHTDRNDPQLYDGNIQGGITIKKWRQEGLLDWAKRWAWLKGE